MRTKQVSYAFPTSITADHLEKPDGCWLVECGEGSFMPLVDLRIAFGTEREAITAAHELPLPWSGMWLQVKHLEYIQLGAPKLVCQMIGRGLRIPPALAPMKETGAVSSKCQVTDKSNALTGQK